MSATIMKTELISDWTRKHRTGEFPHESLVASYLMRDWVVCITATIALLEFLHYSQTTRSF